MEKLKNKRTIYEKKKLILNPLFYSSSMLAKSFHGFYEYCKQFLRSLIVRKLGSQIKLKCSLNMVINSW